ncbi:MAG TPA: hypothetical protein PLT26_16780 [Anaerolineaceae bacterium]|nr:hypothetical protein [Anaerolineaceae bacterium]
MPLQQIDLSIDTHQDVIGEGYKRLVMAMVIQALKDAGRGSQEAFQWLKEEAPDWLQLAGIEVYSEQLNDIAGQSWQKISRNKRRRRDSTRRGKAPRP